LGPLSSWEDAMGRTMWQVENFKTGETIRANSKKGVIALLKEKCQQIDEWGFAHWIPGAEFFKIGRKLKIVGDTVSTAKVYRITIYRNGHVRWSLT
jgi:hypothetical protein